MKTTKIGAWLVALAMTVCSVGSTLPAEAAPSANGAGTLDANTRYVPEQDATKAKTIATRMWATMTAQRCWYMKNSNNNYSFSGYDNYRYAGYETTAGHVKLLSVGKFGPYDTAEVVIAGSQYWVAVIDAQTITISFVHDNGKFVLNYFLAVQPAQQCV